MAARATLFPTFAVAPLAAIVAPATVAAHRGELMLALAPASAVHRLFAVLTLAPAPAVRRLFAVLAPTPASAVRCLFALLAPAPTPSSAVRCLFALLALAPASAVCRLFAVFALSPMTAVQRVAAVHPLASATVVHRIAAMLVVPGVGATSLAVIISVLASRSSLAATFSLAASRTLLRTVALVVFLGLRTNPAEAGQCCDQRSRRQYPGHRIAPLAEFKSRCCSPFISIASARAWSA